MWLITKINILRCTVSKTSKKNLVNSNFFRNPVLVNIFKIWLGEGEPRVADIS